MHALGERRDPPRLCGEVEQDRVRRGVDRGVDAGGVLAHGLQELDEPDEADADAVGGLPVEVVRLVPVLLVVLLVVPVVVLLVVLLVVLVGHG
ncbi:hypothetical protein GCM10025782_06580 [Pedococcus ginsenosidimutans]|uniref:Uncharacterized protein n=1 Tax=Pedococcus ginsenosidimutans TaxID=490570 RepID=A0ABP8XQE5_9MICO